MAAAGAEARPLNHLWAAQLESQDSVLVTPVDQQ